MNQEAARLEGSAHRANQEGVHLERAALRVNQEVVRRLMAPRARTTEALRCYGDGDRG